MLKYAFLSGCACLLALSGTPWVRALAWRLGAVDEPGGRRAHQGRVPRLGGLAVLGALLGALGFSLLLDAYFVELFFGGETSWAWVLAGALVVTSVGVADDVWSLGPVSKVAFQLLAGAMVLMGGYGISSVTNPLTGTAIDLAWFGIPLTLLWVVGVTNAFNLIDGLDGLAAGAALIASATLFVVSLAMGRVEAALLSITLSGALAGFLYYNFNPASIFLGDSGSLLIGYLLSVLSIDAAQKGATAVVILVPILALGLPIMDTLLALVRRVLGALHVMHVDAERNEYRFFYGRNMSIFRADADHIHHRLMHMGLTHRRAVLLLYGVCVILGALAFLAVTTKGWNNAVLVAVVAAATWIGIRKLGYQEVEVLKRGTLLPLFELPVVNRRLLHAMLDAGFVAAAYLLSFTVVYAGAQATLKTYLLQSVVVVVGAKLSVFVYSGVYRRAYRYTNAHDVVRLIEGLILAEGTSLAALALTFGLPQPLPLLVILDFYFSATLVIGARISFKVLEVLAVEQRTEAVPVLIYGAGISGTTLLREIAQNPALGYRAVAFIDDAPGRWGREVNGLPVLGGVEKLGEIIDRYGAREVIVTSGKIDPKRIAAATAVCGPRAVPLRRFKIAWEQISTAGAPEDLAAEELDLPDAKAGEQRA